MKEEERQSGIDYESTSCSINLDEKFFINDLENRRIFINGEINADIAEQVVYHIIRFNLEDDGLKSSERKPIKIFLCSVGGSVSDGLRIADIIQASSTPVYTVNTGYWYSMGFIIGISADKRFGSKYSTYLIHDGSVGVVDSSGKAHDFLKFTSIVNDKIRELVLYNTKISSDDYEKHNRIEWYLFAEEAKELGVIDQVIGADCNIEDIK